MKSVYLVIASQGMWEDRQTWTDAVFDTDKAAEAYKKWAEEKEDEEYKSIEPDDRPFFDPTTYGIEHQVLNPVYGEEDDLD